MSTEKQLALIQMLSQVPGATYMHGEAMHGVSLPLIDGRVLEIGYTDDDVAGTPNELWIQRVTPRPQPIQYKYPL